MNTSYEQRLQAAFAEETTALDASIKAQMAKLNSARYDLEAMKGEYFTQKQEKEADLRLELQKMKEPIEEQKIVVRSLEIELGSLLHYRENCLTKVVSRVTEAALLAKAAEESEDADSGDYIQHFDND